MALAFVITNASNPPFIYGEGKIWEFSPALLEATEEYYRKCTGDSTCPHAHEADPIHSSCCGSCTCDVYCMDHGSCCLSMYHSFSQAKEAFQYSRYECLRAQQFNQNNADYNADSWYWMITECDPEYLDRHDIDQCLKRGFDFDLDSAVPVTDLITNRHFRNKFCAYCNFMDNSSLLIDWKLQVKSSWPLSFPNRGLLQELNATRGNVLFIPPTYVPPQRCHPIPDYTIDKCNVTGLWKRYTADVDDACVSYTDPFNNTYKNFFCYLCNNGDEEILIPEDMKCSERDILTDTRTPYFAAVLDLQIIKEGPFFDDLVCNDVELKDNYSHVCREVFCHEQRMLEDGACKVFRDFKKECVSVFLKLTPSSGERALVMDYVDELIEDLYYQPYLSDFDADAGEVYVFSKTNNTNHIEYLVVYIVKTVYDTTQKHQFFMHVLPTKILNLYYLGELDVELVVEAALYNITITDNEPHITVPIFSYKTETVHVDELTSYTRPDSAKPCPLENTDQMTKLHWCPYIKLGTDEILFEIRNGILLIAGKKSTVDEKPVKILSKWEYELKNGSILICLADYLDIYHTMERKNIVFLGNSVMNPKELSYLLWVCTYISFCKHMT